MFGHLPRRDPGADAIEALAVALIAPGPLSGDNHRIPAGYTYLGQFIDHDITFDPTSQLQRDNDPAALVDFRTPRFDLDSLYGSGPADQPYLYDWDDAEHPGVKLLTGEGDLPRNDQDRALIGDARNDENLVIAQLHLLFVRFHNQVVEHVRSGPGARVDADDLLEEAQRLVRWHFQWIVRHDWLPTVAGKVAAEGFQRRFFTWEGEPFMPVELSGAAFRFGHSMVRESYVLSATSGVVPTFPPAGATGAAAQLHLGGFRALPPELVIEWPPFFTPDVDVPRRMSSMRIDQHLSPVLAHVPPSGAALARLNLQRGRALGLPCGQDVAHAMGEEALDEAELELDGVASAEARQALARATPLWFYVLREAMVAGAGGSHLGPVGGRIVTEVLVGLLEGDPRSYVRQWPGWRPELGGEDGTFFMADLIRFTLDGEARAA